MHLTLFILISWLSVVKSLSLSFPPDGMPTAALKTQMVTWKRGKSDPNSQFFLQKIKLDNSKGPTPKSTPVAITNSQNYEGTSPMAFNRAGLFQIIAVDIQNEKTFFSTEITVLPNPTSYLFPTATSGSKTGKSMMNMMGNPSKVTSLQNSASSSSGSAITIFGPLGGPTMTSYDDSMSSSPASSGSTNHIAAAIIGGIVGFVAFAFVVGVILLFLRYRTRRRIAEFAQTKIVRGYIPDPVDQWGIGDHEKDVDDYATSFASLRRSTLRPQDSVSNIQSRYIPPVLPPIAAARSITSSDASSSVSSTNSARRTRDRKTPSLSISTLSSSHSSVSLRTPFPIPVLPPRTRTDRQMLIEEDIQRLQARMLFLQGNGDISLTIKLEREDELKHIYRKVEILKKVHESKWALGLTDEIPSDS